MSAKRGLSSGRNIGCVVSQEIKDWYTETAKKEGVPLDTYLRRILVAHYKANQIADDLSVISDDLRKARPFDGLNLLFKESGVDRNKPA